MSGFHARQTRARIERRKVEPPSLPPKTLGDYFSDWEASTFGFGYGTGEPYTVRALKTFMDFCPAEGCYDYEVLERELGGPVAWLLINALCRHPVNVLEYGTSPRGAWLTPNGQALKAFIDSKTVGELLEFTCRDHEYIHCHPNACNCSDEGYVQGKVCPNPFFHERFGRSQ